MGGMVRSVRTAGRQLRFIDLWSGGEQKIQLIVRADRLAGAGGHQLAEQLRRGDRIGR